MELTTVILPVFSTGQILEKFVINIQEGSLQLAYIATFISPGSSPIYDQILGSVVFGSIASVITASLVAFFHGRRQVNFSHLVACLFAGLAATDLIWLSYSAFRAHQMIPAGIILRFVVTNFLCDLLGAAALAAVVWVARRYIIHSDQNRMGVINVRLSWRRTAIVSVTTPMFVVIPIALVAVPIPSSVSASVADTSRISMDGLYGSGVALWEEKMDGTYYYTGRASISNMPALTIPKSGVLVELPANHLVIGHATTTTLYHGNAVRPSIPDHDSVVRDLEVTVRNFSNLASARLVGRWLLPGASAQGKEIPDMSGPIVKPITFDSPVVFLNPVVGSILVLPPSDGEEGSTLSVFYTASHIIDPEDRYAVSIHRNACGAGCNSVDFSGGFYLGFWQKARIVAAINSGVRSPPGFPQISDDTASSLNSYSVPKGDLFGILKGINIKNRVLGSSKVEGMLSPRLFGTDSYPLITVGIYDLSAPHQGIFVSAASVHCDGCGIQDTDFWVESATTLRGQRVHIQLADAPPIETLLTDNITVFGISDVSYDNDGTSTIKSQWAIVKRGDEVLNPTVFDLIPDGAKTAFAGFVFAIILAPGIRRSIGQIIRKI